VLSIEHRAAAAPPPVTLELVASDPSTTHLAVIAELREDQSRSLQERLLNLLAYGESLTRAKIRDALAVKNERLGEVLDALEHAGHIRHTAAGWQRAK
jgi:hypothetical protein